MRTQEFIKRSFDRINAGNNKSARCASVFTEGEAVYSYGYHYPLLFVIYTPGGDRVWVCNDRGYSSTTSKHIAYSAYLADVCAELPRGERYGDHYARTSAYDQVLEAIEAKRDRAIAAMAAKKRKDTQVYRAIEREAEQCERYINILMA